MTYDEAEEWFETVYELYWPAVDEANRRALMRAAFRARWSQSLEDALLVVLDTKHPYRPAPVVQLPTFAPPAPVAAPTPRAPPAAPAPKLGAVERTFARAGAAIDKAVSRIARSFGRIFRR